jgi:DNA polymerase-3 subunit delta
MDYAGLLREIDRHAPPTVTLLHGSDSLLADDAVRLLTRVLFPDPALAALDREILDARETSADTIARSAATFPFVASRRLVVVRHAEGLPAKGSERLGAYLSAPSPSTCLLLAASESLRGDRHRQSDHWLLRATPPGNVVELTPLRGAALERALRQRAQIDGLDLSDEAARLLVELVGEDLGRLLGEAHKAALAGGPDNRRVGAGEVAAVVGESRLRGLFELTASIERGDRSRALALLDQVLAAGEEPLVLLALITRDLRNLWVAREESRRGQPAPAVARRLRLPPPVAERLIARGQQLGSRDLADRLVRCWQVEHRVKSGGQPTAELTALITELC